MVNRNLMRAFEPPAAELQEEFSRVFAQGFDNWLPADGGVHEHQLVSGRVLRVSGGQVWIDVGCKTEGAIELAEWHDDGLGHIVPPQPGDQVEVLLESVEDESGLVAISYRKARRQKEWEAILAKHKEGDVVSGVVTRKIKG